MRYVCKTSNGEITGLAVKQNKGIEFYPLPDGEKQFFNTKKLSNGFFIMESVPEEIFNAVMGLFDGSHCTPRICLIKRYATIRLVLGIGSGLGCLEVLK